MIKELFKKDIHRSIEGVIKADNLSDEAILQEVEEYVVTKELTEKFDQFFDQYSSTIGKKTESVGVWISGFFGSGKSHLLKILSYILSSKRVDSKDIGKIFLEKIEDELLKANIKKALSIKAETILFNIDQKADTGAINRKDDAILNVFMKVFNEMRGYYHKQGYIAD
ncbi:MAG TPA: BREX system P-loop protein BrxC, partial [Campylobacterales bacterium]|nr:BREX system P-loop protein BrxC [Campylobacterales bacterium]